MEEKPAPPAPVNPFPQAPIFTVPKKDSSFRVAIILLLFALIAIGFFIVWLLWKASATDTKHVKPVKQASQERERVEKKESGEAFSTKESKKIAYVINSKYGDEVWIINNDGTGKDIVATKAGPAYSSFYPALSWNDSNHLTYVQCEEACAAYTHNLTTKTAPIEVSFSHTSDKVQILAIAWNHAGKQLAYIYKLPDGQMRMDFKSGQVKNTVKVFSGATTGVVGRGGSLDDDVSIHFSPDDKYVLVTNTIGQPNNVDKSTIWVFESSGKEILNIKSDTNSWATQAVWLNNDTVVYKQGSYLRSYSLIDKDGGNLPFTAKLYNPATLYKGGNVTDLFFWVSTNTFPYIGNEGGGEGTPVIAEKFIEGYYKPQLFSEGVVALKANRSSGEEIILPFNSVGISFIGWDKEVIDLDSGDINLFAISP